MYVCMCVFVYVCMYAWIVRMYACIYLCIDFLLVALIPGLRKRLFSRPDVEKVLNADLKDNLDAHFGALRLCLASRGVPRGTQNGSRGVLFGPPGESCGYSAPRSARTTANQRKSRLFGATPGQFWNFAKRYFGETSKHTYTHTQIHTCIHTCITYIHTYTHTYIHTYIHT